MIRVTTLFKVAAIGLPCGPVLSQICQKFGSYSFWVVVDNFLVHSYSCIIGLNWPATGTL